MNTQQQILLALCSISNNLNKQVGKQLNSEFGIDLADWMIISIAQTQPLTQNQLAEKLGFTPAGITNAIDKLVKLNLVERVADNTDRRKNFIHLTKVGVTVWKSTNVMVNTSLSFLFAEMSEADRAKLSESLEFISNKMKNI